MEKVVTLSIQLDSHLAALDRQRRKLVDSLSDRLAMMAGDVNDLTALAKDDLSPVKRLQGAPVAEEPSSYATITNIHPKSVLQEVRQLDALIVAAEAQKEAMNALLSHANTHIHRDSVSEVKRSEGRLMTRSSSTNAWRIDPSAHVPPLLQLTEHESLLLHVRQRLAENHRHCEGTSDRVAGHAAEGCEFDCDKMQAKLIQCQAARVIPPLRLRRCVVEEEAVRHGVHVSEANGRGLVELMFFVSIPTHRRAKELCKAIFSCENANKALTESNARLQQEIAKLAAEFERVLSAHVQERSTIVAHFDNLVAQERHRADNLVSNILLAQLDACMGSEEDARTALCALEREDFEMTIALTWAHITLPKSHLQHIRRLPAEKDDFCNPSLPSSSFALISAAVKAKQTMDIGSRHLSSRVSEQITQVGLGLAAEEYHLLKHISALRDVEQANRRLIALEEAAEHGRELHAWHFAVFQMRMLSQLSAKDHVITSLQRQLASMQAVPPSSTAVHWSAASSRSPSAGQSPPGPLSARGVPAYYYQQQPSNYHQPQRIGITERPFHRTGSTSPGASSIVSDMGPKHSPLVADGFLSWRDDASHRHSTRSYHLPAATLSSSEMVLSMCEGLEMVDRDQVALKERSDWRIIADTKEMMGI